MKPGPKPKPLSEKFWEKVDKRGPDECWNWTASVGNHGYGQIGFNHTMLRSHRVAYEFTNGPISEGMHVLHSCNNRRCCNPLHLREGTNQDNTDDKVAAGNAPKGEKHGYAKLNEKKVRAIREIYALGDITHRQLARLYEVSKTNITFIINRQTWKHVN